MIPKQPALPQQGKSQQVFSSLDPLLSLGNGASTPPHGCQDKSLQKPAVRAPRTLVMSTARPAAGSGQWACLCCQQGQVSLPIPRESGNDVTHSKEALPCLCNNEACVLEASLLSQGQERKEKTTLLMTEGQKGQKPTVLRPPQHGGASGGLQFSTGCQFSAHRSCGALPETCPTSTKSLTPTS